MIANLAGVLKKTPSDLQLSKIESLMTKMQEVDNNDVQEPLGKMLAKVSGQAGACAEYAKARLEKVFQKEGGASLNVKRNSAVYLY